MDTDVQGSLTPNCGLMDNASLKKGLAHLLQDVLNNIDDESEELIPLEPEAVMDQILELDGELKGISIIPMGSGKKNGNCFKIYFCWRRKL